MSSADPSVEYMCEYIRRRYSACDVSDALLKLNVPAAGFIPDLAPLQGIGRNPSRIVAPISTAILLSNSSIEESSFPAHVPSLSNISKGSNWTDFPSRGTIVLIQQPKQHISAILGDIMATRLLRRGVLGVVADGRVRDVKSCADICNDGAFQIWSRGISAAGPSLEAMPWAVNIPLQVGKILARSGDILCADEEDQAVVVIPQERLLAVFELLPTLKAASEGVMNDVQHGLSLPKAVQRHPDFYSNYH